MIIVVVGCEVVVGIVVNGVFFNVAVCVVGRDVGRVDVDVANVLNVDGLVSVFVACRDVVGRVSWSCGCVVVGRVSGLVKCNCKGFRTYNAIAYVELWYCTNKFANWNFCCSFVAFHHGCSYGLLC